MTVSGLTMLVGLATPDHLGLMTDKECPPNVGRVDVISRIRHAAIVSCRIS